LESGALELWKECKEFADLASALRSGPGTSLLHGLDVCERSFLAAALKRLLGTSMLIVTYAADRAETIRRNVEHWLGTPPHVFPALEVLPYEVTARSLDQRAQRIRALDALVRQRGAVIVATVESVLRRLAPPAVVRAASLEVAPGTRLDPDEAALLLSRAGYEPEPQVEGPGQYSRRGGILDVYPLTADEPIRIEFFGDEVESVRTFDEGTQRTLREIEGAVAPPVSEYPAPGGESLERARRRIEEDAENLAARLRRSGRGGIASRLRERVSGDLEALLNAPRPEGCERYGAYLYGSLVLLTDYLRTGSVVVLDEPARSRVSGAAIGKDLRERYAAWLERGMVLPGEAELYAGWEEFLQHAQRHPFLVMSTFLSRIQGISPDRIASISSRPAPSFRGKLDDLVRHVRSWRERGTRTLCVTSNSERARRLSSFFRDEGLDAPAVDRLDSVPPAGSIVVTQGDLTAGFEIPALRLACLSDAEIFGRPKRRRRPIVSEEGRRLAAPDELRPGDYVVHVHHGIGRYLGMKTLEVEGVRRDYLYIRYRGADRLYVPTDQITLVQKYAGVEGREPRLSKLGGTDWSRVKQRVRESVREMAGELLQLYAERKARRGYAFSPDGPWQAEFEDAFPYEETPDQMRAAEEIKRDMEKESPMDRLLCGDVGYGKTEVAMRAAFKAVTNGKQVACLVPTTILAHQHYRTFSERFAEYPVVVEMLSRFRSQREQKDILRRLRKGTVDIVIGTHRLLQDDVEFNDLGLLIVDEEHRFGVAHKERLKQIRRTVDVITMSATPIPRTLHMALVGLRDMSVIETPPEDRYPVETYVVEHDPSLVREAILREVSQGGQVYYVHNRVETIDAAHSRLRRLVPDLRIGMAHGQMGEERLERVMVDFLAGEYDILLCTTIIESGLDIPNVNTLVVEDAHRFGLTQLYQLRGRVGRSNRRAYAYLTYLRDKVLTEAAEKRLQAIREFTEFGSGFRIAMRDLEIRGAGNILGPEQHGFIASVGFDLYSELLAQAVRELKGEPPRKELPLPTVELALDAFIPDDYVPDPRQKAEFYRNLTRASTPRELHEAAAEVEDRCGAMPAPARNLVRVLLIRLRATELGVSRISRRDSRVAVRFRPGVDVPRRELARWAGRWPDRVRFGRGETPSVILGLGTKASEGVLDRLEALLGEWQGIWTAWRCRGDDGANE